MKKQEKDDKKEETYKKGSDERIALRDFAETDEESAFLASMQIIHTKGSIKGRIIA